MSTFSTICFIFSVIAAIRAAPLSASIDMQRDARSVNKFTCKHISETPGKNWRHCSNKGDDLLDVVQMQIPEAVSMNLVTALNIPANSFKCFRTNTYSPSNSGFACPAFCRLRDLKESAECKVGDALNMNHLEEHGLAVVKSPRHDCSESYFRNEICVYNISMPCASDSHVDISTVASEVDLGEGDYLHIVNYRDSNQRFPPIAGKTLTHAQYTIPETNFLMVFTSNRDSSQGRGFKLQLECPIVKELPTEDNVSDTMDLSSGDYEEQ